MIGLRRETFLRRGAAAFVADFLALRGFFMPIS